MTPPDRLLDAAALGEILGLSSRTIANKLSAIRCCKAAPDSLPPWIMLGNKPRWRPADVQAWLEAQPFALRQDRESDQITGKVQADQGSACQLVGGAS